MTGEVVNLRLARKRKKRAEAEAAARENRRRHGMTKAERKISDAERRSAERHVDAHRLDTEDGEKPSGD